MLLLLLAGFIVKGQTLTVPVHWENKSLLKVDGATYPPELNGLPLLSLQLAKRNAEDVDLISIVKTEYYGELPISIPDKYSEIFSHQKMRNRGDEVNYLDILPILYDSINENYFLVESLTLNILTSTNSKDSRSALRRTEGFGNSVLSTGEWYKIPVIEQGIHKIDIDYLKNAGINTSNINPKKIRIYGNGGGMLPQANSAERPEDLIENAILISGQSDGVFNSEDYILFYAQDADFHKLEEDGSLTYEKNFYSDTSFYFLTISNTEGLRVNDLEDLGENHPKITSFDDYISYEKEEYNIINSGRLWFGDKFDVTSTYDLSFDFTELIPDTELSITSSVMGQTYEESTMNLFANTLSLGTQTINTIAQGSYLAKGSIQTETFRINSSQIPAKDELTIRLSYNPVGSQLSKAYLDYLIIKGKRQLKLFGNQTQFRSLESVKNAISTYLIQDVTNSSQVWDITDPLRPSLQKANYTGNSLTFGALSGDLREYIVFNNTGLFIPGEAQKINNQNLHGISSVDFLIITHPLFLTEAERLANFRSSFDGLDVAVVTVDQIYNEFSSGKQDVSAIRDFVKYIYDQGIGEERLQSVLLFGKGSFDYKDRIDRNTNFVPIYSSRNSLHPISSFSSDDFYTFMDDEEGEWVESGNGNHLMDLGVGRLPVKTQDESRVMVDKLIRYSSSKEALGEWRNELIFVADDGDNNLHQRDADKLATLVDTSYTQFNINKIYVDAFEQISSTTGEIAPGAKAQLDRSIEHGGLIVNFTGHGSPTRWTSETILNITSAVEMENSDRLPLFVTATCEFGRHENPKSISGAEYLLNNPNGGAIGLVTTSRPVYSSTNFILNQAFYNQVFKKEEGRYLSIGEVFRRTKNHPSNGLVNRNFSLLADPSMTLTYAKEEIRIIADEDAYQPADTLKALEKVKLKGEVLSPDGTLDNSFNGSVLTTVFDKVSEIVTFGHEDPKMTFLARDNILFRGEATVKNGQFEVAFIVPKNIQYDFDKGKINMYAFDESTQQDAAGSNIDFLVGGESISYTADNTPPEIQLYINDTSFVEGGITGPDIQFLGYLQDESGISTSKSDDGMELTIILDDSLVVRANEYYVAESDTYKKGWVTYPFKDLSTGTHKITLQAWDVHNNVNEAQIEFRVTDGNEVRIENLMNYPNPFKDQTTFSFEHNRAGEDLEISVEVVSMTGQLISKKTYIEENSPGRITNIAWDSNLDSEAYLKGGMYIFRLGVRSLDDGGKNYANHKFVKIN